MTGWVVERSRTAPTTVAPVGASALMPPPSQGAERRTKRHAGRTGSRWVLRALVIGGLAGAAWLLAGTAAQAADHEAASVGSLGSSLIGAVVDGDTAPTSVGTILQAAVQPLDRDRPAVRNHVTSSVRTSPVTVLDRPAEVLAETLDEVARPSGIPDADSTLGAVDRVVRELSGPLRLTGGPADSRHLAPVAAPLTRTLRPIADLLHHAAPAAVAQRPTPAAQPVGDEAAPRPTPAVTPVDDVAAGTADTVAGDRDVTVAPGRRLVAAGERQPIAGTAVTAAAPDPIRAPGGDGPAPLHVHFGALSGLSTSASGAPTEGGCPAYLPAAVADDTVNHRLTKATDVEARRHDAEAPTVSPD